MTREDIIAMAREAGIVLYRQVESQQVELLERFAALVSATEESKDEKQWVGLTDEEIYEMYNEPRSDAEMLEFAREVEAKLKEKNI